MKEPINRTQVNWPGDDPEVNALLPIEEAERPETEEETFSVLVMNEKNGGYSSSGLADKKKEPVITDDHLSLKLSDNKIRELGEDAAQLVGRRALELEREEQELLAIFKEKKDTLKRQEEEKLLSKLRELEESTDGLMKRHREELRRGTDEGRETLRRGEEEKHRLEREEKEARAAGHKEDEEKIRSRLSEIEALEREAAEAIGKKEEQLREKEAGMQASLEEERERLKREEELEFRQKLEEVEEETSILVQQRERELRRAFEAEADGLKREEKEKLDEEMARLAQKHEEALKKNEAEMRASLEEERGRLVREVQEKLEEEKKKLILKEQEDAAKMSRQKDEELERERARLRVEDDEKLKSKLDELSKQRESESRKKDEETQQKLREERERMKREEEDALRQKEEELRKKDEETQQKLREERERMKREEEDALRQKEEELRKKESEMRASLDEERERMKRESEEKLKSKLDELSRQRESELQKKDEETQQKLREERERMKREEEEALLRKEEELRKKESEMRASLDEERERMKHEEEEALLRKEEELRKKDEETQQKLREERERMKREEEDALRQKEEELRKKESEMRTSIGSEEERLRQYREEALKKKLDEILAQKEAESEKKEEEMRSILNEGRERTMKREGLEDRREEMEKSEKEREQKIKEKRDEEERSKHFFLKSMVGGPHPASLAAPIVQKEAAVAAAPSPFFQSNKEEPGTGKPEMTVSEILEADRKKSGLPPLQEMTETKGGDEKEEENEEVGSPQPQVKAGFDRMFGRLFSHVRTMPRGEIYEVSNKLENLFMNVEKMQMELEHQREENKEAKEREGRTSESIGELRSLIFQNESAIKEKESIQEKLEMMVNDIDPSRIAAQLKKREDETNELQMKLEKLEKVNVDLVGRIKSFQAKIESIGDIDSLLSMLHDIDEKLRRIEKLKSDTERFSGKAESFYVESDKRLNELLGMKERLVQLEELSNEITRTLDETRLNVNACAKREDVENLKIELNNRRNVPVMSSVSDDTLKREIGTVENQLDELRRQVQLMATTAQLRESIRTFKGEGGIAGEKHQTQASASAPMTATLSAAQPEETHEVKQPSAQGKRAAVPDVETSGQESGGDANPKIAGIRSAMLVLDERYRKGAISKKTYDELKSINEQLIRKLAAQPEKPAEESAEAPEKKHHDSHRQTSHHHHKKSASHHDAKKEGPNDDSVKEEKDEEMVGIRPFNRARSPALDIQTDDEDGQQRGGEQQE